MPTEITGKIQPEWKVYRRFECGHLHFASTVEGLTPNCYICYNWNPDE